MLVEVINILDEEQIPCISSKPNGIKIDRLIICEDYATDAKIALHGVYPVKVTLGQGGVAFIDPVF